MQLTRENRRERRRLRLRRRSRRAYIRSVYALPSLATLGNAICGFAAMYVATLDFDHLRSIDFITQFFARWHFSASAYLIFMAMVFDALDGRLARFARHTTDFGGQLDSLADVISFGCAPAFVVIMLVRSTNLALDPSLSRLIWALGALYMSCAAIRLARFNVSNEHSEQHHFSFLGLPSPGAAATVMAVVLLQQRLGFVLHGTAWQWVPSAITWTLPAIVLATGLLMVSHIRYTHLINRYLRGRKSPATVVAALAIILGVLVAHWYVLAAGTLLYVLMGAASPLLSKLRLARVGASRSD